MFKKIHQQHAKPPIFLQHIITESIDYNSFTYIHELVYNILHVLRQIILNFKEKNINSPGIHAEQNKRNSCKMIY